MCEFYKDHEQRGKKTYSRRCFFVNILRFILGRDGHETLQDRGCKVIALNLGFFTVKMIDNYEI